ncbi:HAD family hydrolase [Streptomyces sp. NPDC058193]|uniref:HAD family hydrolase n=1 Tax=Streptomyces sp. NPDC058193 TaxID=3346373 RepID=UPI0036EA79A5
MPPQIKACLFDLDGVVTKTDVQHRQAWKLTFEPFLARYQGRAGSPFTLADYMRHVDGMPRHHAVHRFLQSRNIVLPPGDSDDPPHHHSEHGLANRKDELLSQSFAHEPIETYPGTIRFVRAVRRSGMSTAVVSASSHCAQVLEACGADDLFDTRIDGTRVRQRNLKGKPAPDSYIEAAAELRATPATTAVFEDGPTGIAAAAAGGFGWIVGLDRCGRHEDLAELGPDLVVNDLAELLLPLAAHTVSAIGAGTDQ